MSITLPKLPHPGSLGLIQYAGSDMQEYAAAVSAEKDADIAGLRAELLKSLADNAALRADAIDRQNNVVAPLRAEVAGLREDAERYRWLRDECPWMMVSGNGKSNLSIRVRAEFDLGDLVDMVDEFDAAIDAARKGEAC